MHIPDGYLGPPTYGGLWALAALLWFFASRRIRRSLKASEVPFLALAAAMSFVIMMFNVPIPGGGSGHATGGTLLAVVIGPWAAAMALTVALFVQALVFGDGGITAFGANSVNLAFVQVFSGYAVYRIISGRREATPKKKALAAGVGAYVGANLSALLAAVELGVQPLLHTGADGAPLYSPFPLGITVPAIMLGHLTLFGIVEAVLTTMALGYMLRAHAGLVRG